MGEFHLGMQRPVDQRHQHTATRRAGAALVLEAIGITHQQGGRAVAKAGDREVNRPQRMRSTRNIIDDLTVPWQFLKVRLDVRVHPVPIPTRISQTHSNQQYIHSQEDAHQTQVQKIPRHGGAHLCRLRGFRVL